MICAIVLAAGHSQRMGTQKLLLPWGNKTVIAHVVNEIMHGPVEQVLVVVGSDSAQIKEALAGQRVTFITNPDSEGDMLSSIRCGLRGLPKECEAVLVALGDQPTVTAELVAKMIRAFHENQRGIVVPVNQGRHGHPMLFSMRFCDELLSKYDGVGLCGLLHAHAQEIVELSATTGALEDMDTPEDYQRLLAG